MKVLSATDFSPLAMQASDIAAMLADQSGTSSSVCLVHCAPDLLVSADIPSTALLMKRISDDLENEAARLRKAGAVVAADLRCGPAVSAILAAAADQSPHLVVMASTGAGLGGRWLMGSVAERVASCVQVPSLVVRDAEPLHAWLAGKQPLRVLCAVDFTTSADAAMAFVRQLTDWAPIHLEAAYITQAQGSPEQAKQPSVPAQDAQAGDIQSLERDVWERLHDALGNLPMEVYVRPAAGSLAAAFVELANERKADLVVVGATQHHGLRRLAGPTFSHGVLVHAATNVLCVPLASYQPEFKVPAIRSVLVATDFSVAGNNAVRHAVGLLPHGGRIKIVHVCHDPSPGINPVIASEIYFDHSLKLTQEKDEAGTNLLALVPRQLSTSSITFSTEVLVHKNPAAAIAAVAETFGADVICLGTHGRNRTAAAILGSTVQSLVSKTTKPVLVTHVPAD